MNRKANCFEFLSFARYQGWLYDCLFEEKRNIGLGTKEKFEKKRFKAFWYTNNIKYICYI